jgi:small subunit ribosomal protein S4
MARYTGPLTKKSRRLGTDLVGNDKAFERRPYPPGMHGRGRVKESEYSLQLREKQKIRYAYGVLEKQLHRYYDEAFRQRGRTGDNMLRLLETRLDNVVYRAGFARTRRQARQLVGHGHFLVNGRRVTVPSYEVTRYDIIDVRERSRNLTPLVIAKETHGERSVPGWMDADVDRGRIMIHQLPVREQIVVDVSEHLIVEYYSRR